MTANLAVHEATLENGCLEVVPKSHKMDVKFLGGGQIHPDWEAAHEWVAVPLKPGKHAPMTNRRGDIEINSSQVIFSFSDHILLTALVPTTLISPERWYMLLMLLRLTAKI